MTSSDLDDGDGPDRRRVEQRADERPPEEAGSADPEAQSAAVLADSDERQARREPVEHRRADEVAGPDGPTPS